MTPCCVLVLIVCSFYSVSTLGQIKFIQGLPKINQWPFRNSFCVWVHASVQAIDLVDAFWEHSNQITMIHFQVTPLPFSNKVCLLFCPKTPEGQACDPHFR